MLLVHFREELKQLILLINYFRIDMDPHFVKVDKSFSISLFFCLINFFHIRYAILVLL